MDGVTKSECFLSPASKAKGTVAGLFVFSHSGDLDPAPSIVSIAATSRTPFYQGGEPITNIHIVEPKRTVRLFVPEKPPESETEMSQVECRTYRLATRVQTARRNHLRIAARDGAIDPEEQAIADELMSISEELEQKADDELGAIALLRTGRTKHTRGIIVDLFPSIGPGVA
jgi:hypothetical protein